MLGQTQDALLQKTEQAISAKVPPNMQAALQRIVTAGLKVMYSPQTHDLMVKQMTAGGSPEELAGAGAAKLLGILYKQSKGTMPMQAAIPAATILMCEGLDFLEKSGKVKIDQNVVGQAMQALSSNLLQLFGVTPEKLQAAIRAKGQQQGAQPAQAPQPAPSGGIISMAAGAQQ